MKKYSNGQLARGAFAGLVLDGFVVSLEELIERQILRPPHRVSAEVASWFRDESWRVWEGEALARGVWAHHLAELAHGRGNFGALELAEPVALLGSLVQEWGPFAARQMDLDRVLDDPSAATLSRIAELHLAWLASAVVLAHVAAGLDAVEAIAALRRPWGPALISGPAFELAQVEQWRIVEAVSKASQEASLGGIHLSPGGEA